MIIDVQSSLTAAHSLIARAGSLLNLKQLEPALVSEIVTLTGCSTAALFSADAEVASITLRAVYPLRTNLDATIMLSDRADPVINAWLIGKPALIRASDPTAVLMLQPALNTLQCETVYSVPLMRDDSLCAVLMIDGADERANAMLRTLQSPAATVFGNARLHTNIVNELEQLQKIDRELADIANERAIYDFTLDWVLRLTLADAASVTLYNDATETQQVAAELGYTALPEQLALVRAQHGGIIGRVARSVTPLVIPNVADEPDYLPLQANIQSHLSVPVIREDRVIAVITAESRRLNAFTDAHLDFVIKLAARAGIAIDNARLYDEAVRKREQLALILKSITDVVIVVDDADRIVLINTAALSTFHLDPNEDYTGKLFTAIVQQAQVAAKFQRAKETGKVLSSQLTLGDEAVYYANFAPLAGVGWIIVMRDITPLKATEQLKHELISLTTHDLKQPLTVIGAYIELMQIRHNDMGFTDPDGRIPYYIHMAQDAIKGMLNSITNLIYLAGIESGIDLDKKPVSVDHVVRETLNWVKSFADTKHMQIITEVPQGLPEVAGDETRLVQIFNNIVGNAVKYTPDNGIVRFKVELQSETIRFTVSDNGVGIRPQDQPHVFERFYRARRPETENIEGSGLGLAIVKRLVDLHDGEIGLESEIGVGTTFYVTLPIYGKSGLATPKMQTA